MKKFEYSGIPLIESPFFEVQSAPIEAKYREIANQIHKDGFAIIDFPDSDFDELAEKIKSNLLPKFDFDEWRVLGWKSGLGLRLIDEWENNPDVKSIAINSKILEILRVLYGREPFPFQTLSFPVGTQQNIHADTMHFNSLPERWMCGVWVALEDIDENNGPLVYYPGSHKWPILWGEHLDLDLSKMSSPGQHLFDPAWQEAIRLSGITPKYLHCKKGQALIWTANLLHGGSKHLDPSRTRWSQVTHYYFEGCTYWRPYASNLSSGEIFTFNPPNIIHNRKYQISDLISSKLPHDFDASEYKSLHSDLFGLSASHAAEHYILHGKNEMRPYKK